MTHVCSLWLSYQKTMLRFSPESFSVARQPITLRVFKAAECVDQWERSSTRKTLQLCLCFLFARPARQRPVNEVTVLYLSCSSASMDSCFLIVVFVFAFSLSSGERTLKFVTVVSIMYLSRLLPVCVEEM